MTHPNAKAATTDSANHPSSSQITHIMFGPASPTGGMLPTSRDITRPFTPAEGPRQHSIPDSEAPTVGVQGGCRADDLLLRSREAATTTTNSTDRRYVLHPEFHSPIHPDANRHGLWDDGRRHERVPGGRRACCPDQPDRPGRQVPTAAREPSTIRGHCSADRSRRTETRAVPRSGKGPAGLIHWRDPSVPAAAGDLDSRGRFDERAAGAANLV